MGKHHCTIDLLFDWFGLACFANKNKHCQLSYNWFQTSQTGGQWYSDTFPFSIPWPSLLWHTSVTRVKIFNCKWSLLVSFKLDDGRNRIFQNDVSLFRQEECHAVILFVARIGGAAILESHFNSVFKFQKLQTLHLIKGHLKLKCVSILQKSD